MNTDRRLLLTSSAGGCLAALFSSTAVANQIRRFTFEEQVQRSSTVVVAIVREIDASAGARLHVGVLDVLSWLKGETAQRSIRVMLGGNDSELSLGPLSPGSTYMLCLRAGIDGLYHPTNGPYSAWPISTDR